MTISYSKIQEVSKSFVKDKVHNPVGVFAGSTSGIGENIAYEFAKLTIKPTMYIVGRNVERGETVKSNIEKLNPGAKVTFLQSDLSFVKEAKALAETITGRETKINVLSLTQGELLYQNRTETKEGLDEKMALSCYGRWTIVSNLIQLVQQAADLGEPARVLTVLGAGYEQIDDFSDLEMKKKYSFMYAMRTAPAYNSLLCLRFARLYPDIAFVHTNPGPVKTKVGRSLPFYMKLVWGAFTLVSRSPEKAGQYHLYAAYTGQEFNKGAHILDENLEDASANSIKSGLFTVEHENQLWVHTEEMINRALSS